MVVVVVFVVVGAFGVVAAAAVAFRWTCVTL
jgi:hypothetical protein